MIHVVYFEVDAYLEVFCGRVVSVAPFKKKKKKLEVTTGNACIPMTPSGHVNKDTLAVRADINNQI